MSQFSESSVAVTVDFCRFKKKSALKAMQTALKNAYLQDVEPWRIDDVSRLRIEGKSSKLMSSLGLLDPVRTSRAVGITYLRGLRSLNDHRGC